MVARGGGQNFILALLYLLISKAMFQPFKNVIVQGASIILRPGGVMTSTYFFWRL